MTEYEDKKHDEEFSQIPHHHADILSPEKDVIRGQKIGDKSVRFRKVRFKGIKKLEQGTYEIVTETQPKNFFTKFLNKMHLALIGIPIRSKEEIHERLTKVKGLAVFAPDNISSSTYAPEEILRGLMLGGVGALLLNIPIAFAILILLGIVTFSYQQTIKGYPRGGGSYIVTKDNLGNIPGLIAASAILIDYVLTVAVSISYGVAAIISAYPGLLDDKVWLCLVAIGIVMVGNLRGIKESGNLFTIPVYYYIVAMFGLVGYGLFRYFSGTMPQYVPTWDVAHSGITHTIGFFLILRAFASGACGLTGVEAVADGVAAFKPPEAKNAGITIIWMAAIFGSIFFGVSFLADKAGVIPTPHETETVISQLTRTLVGSGWYYYVVQYASAIILLVAANTSFADFPRLASFMANDKFLPSHFAFRGDRLAFNNGIISLACLAGVLVVLFKASTTALIPLYTVGVFVAFTLSQIAMVVHKRRMREPGWIVGACISGFGACVTAVVMIVVGVTKFALGAWMVLILIPIMVFIFWHIHLHYRKRASLIMVDTNDPSACAKELPQDVLHYILIPVSEITKPVMHAVSYAQTLVGKGKQNVIIQAIHVTDNLDAGHDLKRKWTNLHTGIPLFIIESPYRRLIRPLMHYIDAIDEKNKNHNVQITVLVPEVISKDWWKQIYHTNVAFMLKSALSFRPKTVVISFPYHI